MKNKTRVLVIYGGRSGEHEVSLLSGASVIKNLDRSRFEVIPIGIDKEGRWHHVDTKLLENSTSQALPIPLNSPQGVLPPRSDAEKVEWLSLDSKSSIPNIDVVFPVLHGPLCEDGSIQGLFETAGVAYVGAGVLGSAIGMDKDIAKRLIAQAGLPYAPYLCYKESEWRNNIEKIKELVTLQLNFPVFVKPANLGSSVGISKVNHISQLDHAMDEAFRFDRKVLIEKAINAREIEIAVLENISEESKPLVSTVGEIIPSHEFYSYEAKYLDENGASLHIPAAITSIQEKEVRELAGRIFRVLECSGMARIDFFLEKTSGKFYFNEINTIPGFTKISMYPKLWEASGISYPDLLTRLIELALKRHKEKLSLSRSFSPN